jgi:hypothetical protein
MDGWKKEMDKTATDIHIAIIRKYVDEVGAWIFPEQVIVSSDKQE